MKLVWSPEMASKALVDTVKFCKPSQESGEAELISAMAGGWNLKLILEIWSSGGAIMSSIGLAVAANQSRAQHVCIVQNENVRLEYMNAMRVGGGSSLLPKVVVGEAEEVVAGLPGVDFLVVDGRQKDLCKMLRVAKFSHRGAVLLCKNATQRYMDGFLWDRVLGKDIRVVRSVVLPIGQGLSIAYVQKHHGQTTSKNHRRWITKIDPVSGEEHIFQDRTDARTLNLEHKVL